MLKFINLSKNPKKLTNHYEEFIHFATRWREYSHCIVSASETERIGIGC